MAPMVTIQFDIGSNTVNESDGSVTINLVRMGNHSDNITVCIGIVMIMDPAIVQCMIIVQYIIMYVCMYIYTDIAYT